MSALDVWRICQECARFVYDTRQPNLPYSISVARMLFGTAAQESRLQYHRQLGFDWFSLPMRGGYGLWQIERGSMLDSIRWLQARPDLARNAALFLWGTECKSLTWATTLTPDMAAFAMLSSDRIACLFARLHYMRVQNPIPEDVDGQAHYWKTWYNTALGGGTPEQYMANWESLCRPVVEGVTR